jgi:uncharacterized protein (DUF1778 family)
MRQILQSRRQQQLVSWQTRAIATFIVTSGMQGTQEQLDMAKTLSLDPDERTQLAKLVDQPIQKSENRPGSYERLLGALGA